MSKKEQRRSQISFWGSIAILLVTAAYLFIFAVVSKFLDPEYDMSPNCSAASILTMCGILLLINARINTLEARANKQAKETNKVISHLNDLTEQVVKLGFAVQYLAKESGSNMVITSISDNKETKLLPIAPMVNYPENGETDNS